QISDLTTRAENAWTWYSNSNNKTQQCDGGEIEAGDADGSGGHYSSEHVAEAVVAAVYLYALTGKSVYNNYVKNNYTQCRPYTVGSSVAEWSIYRVNQGEALLYYSQLNNADNATKNAILNTKTSSAKSSGTYYSVQENQNLYRARAYFLNWGSNSLMSRNGSDNMDFLNYGLNTGSHANYRERGQAIVNYMHGVNPFGMVYLSNMYGDGAELCADEMWHTWFKHGTQYDNINGSNVGPAPGILSGGAQVGNYYLPVKIGTNEFSADVRNQPDQKRFSVKNDGANNGTQEAPWAYNEPAIYYQASYVKLLANFVAGNGNPPNPTFDDDIISVSNPGSFSPGEPFTVTVDYESSTTRDIYVKLEIDQSPWTAQADVERQTVNAGTGTLTFTITPYNNVPIANNAYKLQTVITEVGGGWGQRQDNLQKTGLDCVAGQSFDDAIVSTTVPGSFSPGQTVTVTVNYEAASSGDVVVNLQNDSSPWTSRADEARATVSAGTGTLTFNMTVYNNCPIANDAYQFQTYLTSVGGGWGARRAQLNKNNRDCVAASGGTSDDWVYRENLTSGWSNWSWGGTTTLQDGGVKKNGNYSLKFQSTGGAFSPRHNGGKTGSSLNSVKFWARSWNTNYTCNVNVRQNDNNDGPNTGVAVTPTWQQFSLSPAQLGNPSTLKRFIFFVPNGRTLFVDDLRIVYNTSSQGTLSQELDRTALSREATDLNTTEISVYPNPNPGQFTLDLRTPIARETVSIRLYDLNGRLVDRTSISTFAGNNRLRMDYRDSDLATGVYLLRVVSPDGKLDLTQRLSIR
ncbi:MAG: glycoside hydrolase family 9 protein, partial [Bacteroidota bacterium]